MPSIYSRLQHCWQSLTARSLGAALGLLWRTASSRTIVLGLGLLMLGGIGVLWLSPRPVPSTSRQQQTGAQTLPLFPASTTNPTAFPAGPAYLGLRGQTFQQGAVQGVKILEVFPDSPMAQAGLPPGPLRAQQFGSIIVAVDGYPTPSEAELGDILAQRLPGAQLQLYLTDSTGKLSQVLSVTAGSPPQASPSSTPPEAPKDASTAALPETRQRSPQAPPGAGERTHTAPALAWPGEAVAQAPRPAPARTLPVGGATPTGWSERLLGLPLQAVGSALHETPTASASVPPDLLEAYFDRLEVRPVPRTRLVKIAISMPDPELAARLANAHARAYVRQGLAWRGRANEEALQFLEAKLADLKERLEKSEASLNRYRRERGILSLDSRENIVVDRLADLNKRLTEAEAERIALEAQVRLIRKQQYEALPAVLDNRLIQTLKGDLARLEGEQADLATRFKAGYPEFDQLRAKVQQTKRRLQQEIQRTVDGIKSAYSAARQTEDELRKRMEQQKTAALGLKDASVEYAILAREVDTNRQLYDSVLQRLKEMQVAAALRASNVSVIDPALAPLRSTRPNKPLSLLLSAAVGLLGGVGLAFFVEYCHNTLKTPQDVERYLHLPHLGAVPDFVRPARASVLPTITPTPDRQRLAAAPMHPSFVLAHEPFSMVSEAYRTLRTALLLAHADEAPRTLLFTSAVHGEGKTVTTLNTAATLAQMGLRVLVIDADLRCAACHTVLGSTNDSGLAEVLADRCSPSEVIQTTVLEHLFFLSSGTLPDNPTELVASQRMRDTLGTLQTQYDYILIDSPPVMPASDAVMLATLVDGVVLISNAQHTPKHVTRAALARLQYARARMLGVVLNRLPHRSSPYAYYYRQDKALS